MGPESFHLQCISLRFSQGQNVFVLSCNIMISLSILKYFLTVLEAAPLCSST